MDEDEVEWREVTEEDMNFSAIVQCLSPECGYWGRMLGIRSEEPNKRYVTFWCPKCSEMIQVKNIG